MIARLRRLVDLLRRDEVERRILEGYARVPETAEELRSAEASAREMIEEEPW